MAVLPDSAADLAVAHQIAMTRYSNGAVQRIIAILNRADADLFARLIEVLQRAPESANAEYLAAMLSSVRELNAQAYAQVYEGIQSDMQSVSGIETAWVSRLYGSVQDVEGAFARVTAEQAYAAAFSRPFQGRLLREWAQSIEADRMARIRDAVRMGYLEGETTDAIVRRVRGTRARNYADGLLEIDRRHAESVIRTALSHTAQTARTEFYRGNSDLLGSLLWLSTLDARTTLKYCVPRDHKRYTVAEHPKPIGHKLPWGGGPGRIHWGCRSTSLALLKGQTELFGTRASRDGQVSANLSYPEWLKRQPASVQDDVLGSTRGKLYRRGELEIRDFVNDKGRVLTLDALRESDAAAFARAGLD